MYAYIDETGNTGPNLFDKAQPIFISAALITRGDFDKLYSRRIRALANQLGSGVLHANVLGVTRIEEIALDLLAVLKKCDARLFLARVEKPYLALTKMVDTIFDSTENIAVPWHIYNLRPIRILVVFKMAYILDEEVAVQFWSSLMEPNKDRAYEQFIKALRGLLARVTAVPDERSRQVISEAITWAIKNPEAIYFHTNAKLARYQHLPNMVAFPDILDEIEERSRLWGRQVKKIFHDRQAEFGSTLKYWHELISHASPQPMIWPFEKKRVFRKVFGSEFVLTDAAGSAGIQVIDTILWLFKKVSDCSPLPPNCVKLMRFVFRRAKQTDFSYESTSRGLEEFFAELENAEISEEQIKKGNELLKLAEERRQTDLLRYAEEKLATNELKHSGRSISD